MKKLGILIMLVFAPFLAEAASLEMQPAKVGVGALQEVAINLRTGGESINALEGRIILPADMKLVEVRTGGSVVNLWIEGPQIENNEIIFSGLIPGGFEGTGKVLQIRFIAQAEGKHTLQASGFRTYLNDGNGTMRDLDSTELELEADGSAVELGQYGGDKEPPEPFVPAITSSPGLFDGKKFLTFLTQDKLSGMDHYEVMEVPQDGDWFGRLKNWERVDSPYVLNDQSGRSDVFVRAVDKEGNFLVVKVPGEKNAMPAGYVVLTVILVCLIVIWHLFRRK